jgi:hypothetical protein
MELRDAFAALDRFSGPDLTETLSQIEASLQGTTAGTCCTLLSGHHATPNALVAAGLVKRQAGQISVVLHALGILLCLPKVLQPGEVVAAMLPEVSTDLA